MTPDSFVHQCHMARFIKNVFVLHHYIVFEFQLPQIAKGIGKKPFKMYIEMFLDSIFYSLVSMLGDMFVSHKDQSVVEDCFGFEYNKVKRGHNKTTDTGNEKSLGKLLMNEYAV